MPEVWLRTNRRALALGMILPALLVLGGVWLIVLDRLQGVGLWASVVGGIVTLGGLGLAAQLLYWMRLPRLAYASGHLLVYLDSSDPIRVPIDVVECFFIGQGASQLPKLEGQEPETANVIVRLAEAASEWKHRDVRPSLGHWCESYITINGAWCEPLGGEAIKRLNARLVQVHRELRAGRAERLAGEKTP
jgi:hypothetical protein